MFVCAVLWSFGCVSLFVVCVVSVFVAVWLLVMFCLFVLVHVLWCDLLFGFVVVWCALVALCCFVLSSLVLLLLCFV